MSEISIETTGVVNSRNKEGGPPRETEIYNLNPTRKSLIQSHTKWEDVFPGTLNVKLEKKGFQDIETLEPFFSESKVEYPEKYKSIPLRKGSYLYYMAEINSYEVLLRTTQRDKRRNIGIIANVNLKRRLGIEDSETVNIKIKANKKIRRDYFFNHYNKKVFLDNIYKDAHVFLISSGPSLKGFPYFNKLKFVKTMGLNNSPKVMMPYCRPDLWTCVDGPDKFLYTIWEDPKTMKLVPREQKNKLIWNNDLMLPESKKVKDCPNVVYWTRNNSYDKETYLTEDTINWGNNAEYKASNGVKGKRSVFIAAVKLLYVLGFRHVYLLGVDFNMSTDNTYAFEQSRKDSSIKGNTSSYSQMNYWFTELQPKFLEAGFHVYNCNPDSGLKAFPYMSFEEAFKRSLDYVHDIDKFIKGELEHTQELYNTKVWKCSVCGKWQRHPEKSLGKEEGKREHFKATGNCLKCGKELSTMNKDRKQ